VKGGSGALEAIYKNNLEKICSGTKSQVVAHPKDNYKRRRKGAEKGDGKRGGTDAYH